MYSMLHLWHQQIHLTCMLAKRSRRVLTSVYCKQASSSCALCCQLCANHLSLSQFDWLYRPTHYLGSLLTAFIRNSGEDRVLSQTTAGAAESLRVCVVLACVYQHYFYIGFGDDAVWPTYCCSLHFSAASVFPLGRQTCTCATCPIFAVKVEGT